MPIHPHDELPVHQVPRITTRVLASAERGAAATAVWEQWIEADGFIPLHYHEEEEVLIFLAGAVRFTQSEETHTVTAPATVIVPAGQVHGLRPAEATSVHLLALFPTPEPQIFSPDGSLRPLPWEDFES